MSIDIIPPERRPDGSFRYPVQMVVQSWGKFRTGYARFETVGWASDLAHQKRLQECLR